MHLGNLHYMPYKYCKIVEFREKSSLELGVIEARNNI